MKTINRDSNSGREARYLIVKMNNLAHRLEDEGALCLADYTEGLVRNPDQPAPGQLRAIQTLSKRRCRTSEARRLSAAINDAAEQMLAVTGWDSVQPETNQEPNTKQPKPVRARKTSLSKLSAAVLTRMKPRPSSPAASRVTAACA